MHYFLDTEFTDLPWTTSPTLISIGIVKENGESYFACLSDFDHSRVSEFVKQNIIPSLPPETERKYSDDVRREILKFISPAPSHFWSIFPDESWVTGLGVSKDLAVEYVKKFGDFDFQLTRQLIGDLYPSTWPKFGCNLNSIIAALDNHPQIPTNSHPHNALSDAKYAREVWLLATANNIV